MSGRQQGFPGRGGGGGTQGRGNYGGGRGQGPSDRGAPQGRGGRGGAPPGRGSYRGGRGQGPNDRGGQDRGRGGRGGPGGGRGGGQRGPIVPPGIYIGSASAPDPAVKATEDALALQTRGKTFEGMPGRPGYGTEGMPIVLRANYFKLDTAYEIAGMQEKNLHAYSVAILPDGFSKQKKHRILEMITADDRFQKTPWATDYSQWIVTTDRLDLGPSSVWEGSHLLPPEPENTVLNNAPQGPAPEHVQQAQARNRFNFKVEFRSSLSPRQAIDHLRSVSSGGTYAGSHLLIQALNIIMCKPPHQSASVTTVGSSFFPYGAQPQAQTFALGGGLHAHRGYYSSVRPAVGRLLVNLNVTAGAFYEPGPLIELLRAANVRGRHAEVFIRMLRVKVTYTKDSAKTPFMTKIKTIAGFAPANAQGGQGGDAGSVQFQFRNPSGQQQWITVKDYFKTVHGITLERPELPVLNVGTRADPQYIPPEMAYVLPGQAYRRFLNGRQTTNMLGFAARAPNQNAMAIAGTAEAPGNCLMLFGLAGGAQSDSVEPFGFRVRTQMISVPGRILTAPDLKYKSEVLKPQKGSWNCLRRKYVTAGSHGRWQVWSITYKNQAMPTYNENALSENGQTHLVEFHKHLTETGITLGAQDPLKRIKLDPLLPEHRTSNDARLYEAFEQAKSKAVGTLFILLPEVDRWLYARIKFYGDVKFGIHTINAVGQKFQKTQGQGMFFGNLALKFNLKGGGISHTVPNTLVKPLDKSTMVMGIDVTHPSPGSTKGAPSIAAIVASVDEHLFQWPGSIQAQTGREEMVAGVEEMVIERLDLWRKKNGCLPNKIVVYRDGVSEGQYETVLNTELPLFHHAFEKRFGKKEDWPKMAIIIVGKRHHTRFYPTAEKEADVNPKTGKGSWNPLPGTVVDRGVVGRVVHEFYLQAHQGLQGTARPAHYVVIKNDISFSADDLEQFTHKLCFHFNRATKAVSICPPAYYSDLLCERGRAYLYSVMAEDGGSNAGWNPNAGDWTRGVHERLAETTWYV